MKEILDLLFTLEYMPFKNKGRILQAYRTLIGSRLSIAFEFEFNGSVTEKTAMWFIGHVETHPLYSKCVVMHNMGYDGRPYSKTTHDFRERCDDKREYRIRFSVQHDWKWCRILKDILTMFYVLEMQVGSIHLHLNAIGDYKIVGKKIKRMDKPCLVKHKLMKNRAYARPLNKEIFKLYGTTKSHLVALYRYKTDLSTQTLEIRVITPTVFYAQLLMEILYWEQVFKERQDGYRRSLKKDLIIRKYMEHSTELEENLGSPYVLRGPLLTRGIYNEIDENVLEAETQQALSSVDSFRNWYDESEEQIAESVQIIANDPNRTLVGIRICTSLMNEGYNILTPHQ